MCHMLSYSPLCPILLYLSLYFPHATHNETNKMVNKSWMRFIIYHGCANNELCCLLRKGGGLVTDSTCHSCVELCFVYASRVRWSFAFYPISCAIPSYPRLILPCPFCVACPTFSRTAQCRRKQKYPDLVRSGVCRRLEVWMGSDVYYSHNYAWFQMGIYFTAYLCA